MTSPTKISTLQDWFEIKKHIKYLDLAASYIPTMTYEEFYNKNDVYNGLVLDKNGHKMSKRLGNAVDPFETIKNYGPDATRWYMISNANPWDNLKFDAEGIAEASRKFFGTLY